MKVIVLAGRETGVAALHLKSLLESGVVDVVAVVYSEGRILNRKKFWLRKIKKALRIGVFGVLNGIRIRSWFDYPTRYSLKDLCETKGIPYHTTPATNHPTTEQLFKDSNSDLGLSLGNGYIAPRIFGIPKLGMVNIHHEILPDFQNAQSVIWALYEGRDTTGYTIHKINTHMDGGDILWVQKNNIIFGKNLCETVVLNVREAYEQSARKLPEMLANFEKYCNEAQNQVPGRTYTTPGLFAWMRMLRNHRILKNKPVKG